MTIKSELQVINSLKYFILTTISGLILPFILLPIIKVTGYSEIIEELAKMLIVLLLVLRIPNNRYRIIVSIIFGLLFGLSESILYLNNIFHVGDMAVFWNRLLLTVPLHIVTVLVILLPALKNKKLIILGYILALIIHYLFNYLIYYI